MDNPTPDGPDPGEFETPFVSPVLQSFQPETGAWTRPPESPAAPPPGMLTYAVAGLHAGMVGVIWMFACFAIAAYWNGSGIWSVPNLLSTVFYGDYAFDDQFFRFTWAGLAILIVVYGLLGILWGCIWKQDRKPLLSFYGALTGLAVYYVFFHFIWPRANPMIAFHAPVRQLAVAHILWGAALARSPGYSREIAAAAQHHPAAMQSLNFSGSGSPTGSSTGNSTGVSTGSQDGAESVSGELIQ